MGLTLIYILAGLQLVGVMVVALATARNLRHTRPPVARPYPDNELPTLTVAIPARNETDSLEACLQSLVTSNYPKLEILVLDDCSQNRRTPAIIKAFAQSGVRFIGGQMPPESWLAKNYAYHQLAAAANGELLLFCGVDTRFEPGSLTNLVTMTLRSKLDMVSIMPANLSKHRLRLSQLLIQPNRYAWEVGLPRLMVGRPPVLSTCWLIRHQALKKSGGFEAVRHSILPESYLARYTANSGHKYRFWQATPSLGITSLKSAEEQRDTSLRMRYPQMHRRLSMVLLVSLLELALFVWPPLMMLVAGIFHFWLLAGLSGLALVIGTLTHSAVVNLTYRRFVLRGLFLLPLAALYDIWLLNYSMWRYKRGRVIWKGRNICLPLMLPADSARKS